MSVRFRRIDVPIGNIMFDKAFINIVNLEIKFVSVFGAICSAGLFVRKATFEIGDGFPYYVVGVFMVWYVNLILLIMIVINVFANVVEAIRDAGLFMRKATFENSDGFP